MIDVGIAAALAAGILSFLSPCVLPLVPPYLCYLAGVSLDELRAGGVSNRTASRILLSALAFVLGFATVFVSLGATASIIGRSLAYHLETLALFGGIAI